MLVGPRRLHLVATVLTFPGATLRYGKNDFFEVSIKVAFSSTFLLVVHTGYQILEQVDVRRASKAIDLRMNQGWSTRRRTFNVDQHLETFSLTLTSNYDRQRRPVELP